MITFTYHATIVDDGGPGTITVTPDGFECSLDGSMFAECDDPASQTYSDLTAGAHHFEVRSYVFDNGEEPTKIYDQTPATWDWTVITDTVIDTAIDGTTANIPNGGTSVSDMITFTYHATIVDDGGPGTITVTPDGFECSLDGSMFAECDDPASQTYSDLTAGAHHFEVRSYVFDNGEEPTKIYDQTPATWDWTVITDTVIDTAIDGTTANIPNGDTLSRI